MSYGFKSLRLLQMRRVLPVVLVVVSLVVGGCGAAVAARELVGKWSTGTTAADGVHGTSATYEFRSDGTFRMSGYPPIEVKGRWNVIERKEGRLHLRLTDQMMKAPGMEASKWADQDGWAELAEGGASFTFAGQTFTRQK